MKPGAALTLGKDLGSPQNNHSSSEMFGAPRDFVGELIKHFSESAGKIPRE